MSPVVEPPRWSNEAADSLELLGLSRAEAAPTFPNRPIGWYRIAAVEYRISPHLLEALHEVESSNSPDGCIQNRQGSGAIGPFQFKPATFSQFGVDGNHDGLTDICGFTDSLSSAAHYLHKLGADDHPSSEASRRALARYGTHVSRVVSLALAYQDRDRQTRASS